MKAEGIVYCSQTGFTRAYAMNLGERLSLPVYSLAEAKRTLKDGARVVFCGWLMGGLVRGLAGARKKYSILAVVAVGMGERGSGISQIRKTNRLEDSIPLFSLQGGYREKELPFFQRLMMKPVKKALIQSLQQKAERTQGEENSLVMLKNGGDFVDLNALDDVCSLFQAL